MKKFSLEKTKIKPYHYFYLGFFLLYAVGLYYFLYHINGLQPFQVNLHFFSNVIGSFSKRFLSEASFYALLFFLLYYTQVVWKRIALIGLFLILFLVNTLAIAFYFITRSNFQFYILEGFNWHIFFSFFTPTLTLAAFLLAGFMAFLTIILFRIRNSKKKVWIAKKNIFIVLLTLLVFLSPFLPIAYTAHTSVMAGDALQKKFFRLIHLEDSGLTLLFKEITYRLSPPKQDYQPLNADEQATIKIAGLDEKITQHFPHPPKKIVLIVAESLNQAFLSHYNPEIAGATPNLDGLFKRFPHIDDFYPSGPYTLQGVGSLLCGHTYANLTRTSPSFACAPKLMAEAGFKNEFIRGTSKYYVGENIYFKKFGFETLFGKEDFEKKSPEFAETHKAFYQTWGYTDNYVFDEAISRLKAAGPDDKLFLTLLTVDTHAVGGRCAYPKTANDPENPLLFSLQCFDRVFGEFITNLEAENLLNEDTVILLTADQLYPGYLSVPGAPFQTSFSLKPASIPLLMITKTDLNFKAQEGSQIDIAATLLDLANLGIPSYYMGRSLLSSDHSVPMGQDRRDGYLMADGTFFPLSLDPNLREYQTKEIPKGFSIQVSAPEEIEGLAQQKIAEFEQTKNQDAGFYKWYYNKYFGLTE